MSEISYNLEFIRTGRPELDISIEGEVSIGGDIRITKYVPVDTGYELVTANMEELEYRREGNTSKLIGRLGGRPLHIEMPEGFGKEFENKIEQLPEY